MQVPFLSFVVFLKLVLSACAEVVTYSDFTDCLRTVPSGCVCSCFLFPAQWTPWAYVWFSTYFILIQTQQPCVCLGAVDVAPTEKCLEAFFGGVEPYSDSGASVYLKLCHSMWRHVWKKSQWSCLNYQCWSTYADTCFNSKVEHLNLVFGVTERKNDSSLARFSCTVPARFPSLFSDF